MYIPEIIKRVEQQKSTRPDAGLMLFVVHVAATRWRRQL